MKNMNNDLISRQDAIDALEREKIYSAVYKYGYTKKDYFTQYNMGLTDGIKALNKLPSAQPEQQNARIFQGIIVEYPTISTYPEYEGKPYFSIKYTENGQEYIGYGTYKPEVLSEYLKEYFMPSAEPEQIARDIATIIENEQDMRVILQNAEHTETHSCDCERMETHDLVSRRAALEAMDTWDKFGCDPDGKLVRYDDDKHYVPYVHYEDMVYAVKNLPSAQPRWIPVSSDSMPEDGVTVWVTIKGYDVISYEDGETLEQAIDRISKIRWVTQGYWSEEEHGWNDPSFGCPLMVQPIAWMPMEVPEPYKGGDRNDSKRGDSTIKLRNGL